MDENLINKKFWLKHWESWHNRLVRVIPANIDDHRLFKQLLNKYPVKTAIELGGFPGQYPIFLKKYLNIDATLLDYAIDQKLLKAILEINGLTEKDIPVIEADLFHYVPEKQFDLVYSLGLIEHFSDVKGVINRHLPFLKENGVLFIVVPNLRGLNGWVQKYFDRQLYDIHNIDCMDIKLLQGICEQLKLKNIDVKYDGGFTIWTPEGKNPLVTGFVRSILLAGKIVHKLFPLENKFFSSSITIIATKNAG